jgi:hypothetical protein
MVWVESDRAVCDCTYVEHMAKPDMPNFSIGGRIIVGVIALVVIIAMLRLFRVF